MRQHTLTRAHLAAYARHLRALERSPGTVDNYLRAARAFVAWLDGGAVQAGSAGDWKAHLLDTGYAPVTVNARLAAVNGLFRFLGWDGFQTRLLRLQRRLFRAPERELTRAHYRRLLSAAQGRGDGRLALLIEAICATGIRVSEVRCLTLEAARRGRADIRCKGKVRTILLPGKLCRKLRAWAKKQNIPSGELFLTRKGKSLSRRQIWGELKALAVRAGVDPARVFPHNLRHLFAVTFYRACRDVARPGRLRRSSPAGRPPDPCPAGAPPARR